MLETNGEPLVEGCEVLPGLRRLGPIRNRLKSLQVKTVSKQSQRLRRRTTTNLLDVFSAEPLLLLRFFQQRHLWRQIEVSEFLLLPATSRQQTCGSGLPSTLQLEFASSGTLFVSDEGVTQIIQELHNILSLLV